ncbi:MAG: hypothetical protein ACKVVP_02525, partial [Chloroflexota bacterium]
PFYTTLGLWLVLRVMRARTTWPMAVAGFSFGCALQTHLLAGMFFPAVIALVIWKARWLLKDRWTYLGIGAFLAAYSSVIVHNLMYLGDTVKHAQYIRTRHNYLVDGPLPETDSFTILRNMGRTIGMLGETLVTSIGPADDWPGSIDPVLIAVGLISVAFAVVWALRRGQPLPILALLATVLILPVANPGRYTTITDGRYVSPLLPLCFAALAAMLLAIPMSRKVRICAIGAMALVFILQPLGPTLRYGQRVSEEVPSNQAIARSVDVLESWGDESDLVMLDNRLNQGARNIISLRESRAAFDGFTYLLPFERIRVVTTQVSRGAVEDRLRRRDRVFVIVPPGYRSELLVGRVTPIRSADAPAPPDPAAPHRPLYEMYMVEKISGASDSAVPGADVAPAAAP